VAHDALQVGPDLPVAEQGGSELLRDRVLDPVPVADDHRLVEILGVLDRVDLLGRDVRVRPQPTERVTRDGDECEDEKARRNEHRNAVEDPADDEGQHWLTAL
jgi:hypothetical protein